MYTENKVAFINTMKVKKIFYLNDEDVLLTNFHFVPILFHELLKTSASLEEMGREKSINERFLKNQFMLGETLVVKRCLRKCITQPTLHAEKCYIRESARKHSFRPL